MRNIKPENWQTLAATVYGVLNVNGNREFAKAARDAFAAGQPGPVLIKVLGQIQLCIDRTYNGAERARAISLRETICNYGLLPIAREEALKSATYAYLSAMVSGVPYSELPRNTTRSAFNDAELACISTFRFF